jgi:ABC-2 type transport system permease protein
VLSLIEVGSMIGATSSAGDPNGPFAQVLSCVPTSAPMVMPIRMVHGELRVLEMVASLTIVVAMTVVLLRLAERVYRRTALRTGSPTKWREALSATR